MRRHRLVSALFAAQWFEAVRLLPHCFWHNNTCSGFHPPASVMKLLSPTQHKRLNEATGFLLLFAGMVTLLSLISYHVQDPSWNTAASSRPLNLIGYPGAYLSDLCLQVFGASAFLFPLLLFGLAWKWIRSDELHAGAMKIAGAVLLSLAASAALSFLPLRLFGGTVRMGGTLGLALATSLVDALNLAGALLVTATALVISLYLVSSFALAATRRWFEGPAVVLRRFALAWRLWRERRHARAVERDRQRRHRCFDRAGCGRHIHYPCRRWRHHVAKSFPTGNRGTVWHPGVAIPWPDRFGLRPCTWHRSGDRPSAPTKPIIRCRSIPPGCR